ncbi:MAG: porin family protein [Hyphomonas sp.]
MKLALASLAAILAATPAAFAQGDVEISGGYSNFDVGPAEVGALTGRGTYFFNQNFGVEGEASVGVKDDDFGVGTVELDHSLGAFGVLQAPVNERISLFGRLGYASTELSANTPALSASASDIKGVSYGVGAKFNANERFGIRGEFTKHEGDRNDADVVSIGGVMRF